jgi:hypothetical protein
MVGIEFEQKFVLDVRYHKEIINDIISKESSNNSFECFIIRQYYDKNGNRFRHIYNDKFSSYIKEKKSGIKIGTYYSISQESEEISIPVEDFENGWMENYTKRLQKVRYSFASEQINHKIMVDFFYSKQKQFRNNSIYAIVAENETLLTPETKILNLNFYLPVYLERYLLKKVNDADPLNKIFKSTNMIDTVENIEAVCKSIRELTEKNESIFSIRN